jgi:hypothetical protein
MKYSQGRRSFSYAAPFIWTNLSHELRSYPFYCFFSCSSQDAPISALVYSLAFWLVSWIFDFCLDSIKLSLAAASLVTLHACGQSVFVRESRGERPRSSSSDGETDDKLDWLIVWFIEIAAQLTSALLALSYRRTVAMTQLTEARSSCWWLG